MTRKNLRLRLGDIVTVHEAPDVKYATVVQVLPYAEDLEGVTGETFETFLEPFFSGDFKPVRLGLVSRNICNNTTIQFRYCMVDRFSTLLSVCSRGSAVGTGEWDGKERPFRLQAVVVGIVLVIVIAAPLSGREFRHQI